MIKENTHGIFQRTLFLGTDRLESSTSTGFFIYNDQSIYTTTTLTQICTYHVIVCVRQGNDYSSYIFSDMHGYFFSISLFINLLSHISNIIHAIHLHYPIIY